MESKKLWYDKSNIEFHTSMCGRLANGYVSLIFTGTVDRVEFIAGQIRIGKHLFHVDYWVLNYRTLLSELGYQGAQIDEYRNYIMFCAEKYAAVMGKIHVN